MMISVRQVLLFVSLLTSSSSSSSAFGLTNFHPSPKPLNLSWTITPTNSTRQFRGLSPASEEVVWASGTAGTVLRTTDGGFTWLNVSPSLSPGNASTFEFRDIQAFSDKRAVILSIGEGNASRIYTTQDGGDSWTLAFVNHEPTAFYDCMAFEDERHGIALSDPVYGKFRIVETWNGGKSWTVAETARMPTALDGEFAFAASGTCIEAAAGRWYIASGGVDPGRIFSSNDGQRWRVANSSIAGGIAAGVFSVRFRDSKHGIAVGGDYEKPTGNSNISSWSKDGGATWQASESSPAGYRSGLSWMGRGNAAVTVGTTGSDVSFDGGMNWQRIDNGTFDAVECIGLHTCWASGASGRIARLNF